MWNSAAADRGNGDGVEEILHHGLTMKEPEFDTAYRKARLVAFGQCTARLQQASGAAVSAVLKILVDQNGPAQARLRAADMVLTHATKAVEIEEIEARLTELERVTEQARALRR